MVQRLSLAFIHYVQAARATYISSYTSTEAVNVYSYIFMYFLNDYLSSCDPAIRTYKFSEVKLSTEIKPKSLSTSKMNVHTITGGIQVL